MHRGGLLFALIGIILTIVGTVMDPWLDYQPAEGYSAPPALIGLWSYTGETKEGDKFSIEWTDTIGPSNPIYNTVSWWQNDSWVAATRYVPFFLSRAHFCTINFGIG